MGPATNEESKPDIFRQNYTPLTEDQQKQMKSLKLEFQDLWNLLDDMIPQNERSERSRCIAIAKTNLETAGMYAVKALTTKQE